LPERAVRMVATIDWLSRWGLVGVLVLAVFAAEATIGLGRLWLDGWLARRAGERVLLAVPGVGRESYGLLSLLVTDKRLRVRIGAFTPLVDISLDDIALIRYGWHGSFGSDCVTVYSRQPDGSRREEAVLGGREASSTGWGMFTPESIAHRLESVGLPVRWDSPPDPRFGGGQRG
jgi:hypothetical protein